MAAQETAHMLLSLPLVGCSFSFVTVRLENSRKVILDPENQGDDVLQMSVLKDPLRKYSIEYYIEIFYDMFYRIFERILEPILWDIL